MDQKIMIIGCPGAGKSTFARKLRDVTGLPLYYLDMLYHRPDRTVVSREDFDAGLQEMLARDRWIIDGNYQRTLEVRMEACDTIILMDFPLDVCLEGAASRIGTRREDLPWVEEEFDEEFRQWIVDFPQDTLPKIYALLEKYRDRKNVLVFHTREEADTYLRKIES